MQARVRGAHFTVDCQGQAYTVEVTGDGILYRQKGIRNAQVIGKSWSEVIVADNVIENTRKPSKS